MLTHKTPWYFCQCDPIKPSQGAAGPGWDAAARVRGCPLLVHPAPSPPACGAAHPTPGVWLRARRLL